MNAMNRAGPFFPHERHSRQAGGARPPSCGRHPPPCASARPALARPAAALALVLALGACQDAAGLLGRKPAAEAAKAPPADAPSVRLVERDVEAPEIFQVTEPGLWDGRPSLGGVWVAYPGKIEPQRVIIRNTENGKFVIGALFRRERVQPGPRIQISSDAAAALGVLAGKPTALNVTALKRVSAPEVESAPATRSPAAKDAGRTAEGTAAGRKTAAQTAARDPEKPETKAAGGAADSAARRKPVESVAAAAIRKAEERRKAAAADAPRPAPATPAPPRAGGLDKPFIQIGIFSQKKNAQDTATSLRTRGILPVIKEQRLKGKTYWRVIIGPAQNRSERAALLKTARELGFADAYFVTN